MTAILTGDTHWNEKKIDEYRWGLFPLLDRYTADELIICGDLTDAKDRHSATLVNRLYDEMMKLEKRFRLIILKGNHDYIDSAHPFFEFLGKGSDSLFITHPTRLKISVGDCYFIPAGCDWSSLTIPRCDYIFTHTTFDGAISENGTALPGVAPSILRDFKGKCYSGDIHKPQDLTRNITYIGAPYHTRFGDDFKPRMIYLENSGKTFDLHYVQAPAKRVLKITEPGDLETAKAERGDLVKIECFLYRADLTEWRKYQERIRGICEKKGWQLCGSKPVMMEPVERKNQTVIESTVATQEELIERYGKKHKASSVYIDIGKKLMSGEKVGERG